MQRRVLVFVLAATALSFLTVQARAQDSHRGAVVIEAEIPRAGDFLAFGFDAVWMLHGDRLVRVNATDNSIVDIEIEGLTGQNRGLAIGEGAVWVSDVGASRVYAVDPETNKAVRSIDTGELRGTEASFDVGQGAVWIVLAENRNRVLGRYDASTGAELARIELPSTSSGIVVDFGRVWVTGTGGGRTLYGRPSYQLDRKGYFSASKTKVYHVRYGVDLGVEPARRDGSED